MLAAQVYKDLLKTYEKEDQNTCIQKMTKKILNDVVWDYESLRKQKGDHAARQSLLNFNATMKGFTEGGDGVHLAISGYVKRAILSTMHGHEIELTQPERVSLFALDECRKQGANHATTV